MNTIILQDFKPGWQSLFESRLVTLTKFFPELVLVEATRYSGMLRIKYSSTNPEIQELADAVTYKIERESARTCERCGKYGRRLSEHLSEKMCLCLKCYVYEVDEQLQLSTRK
jgi:hypothetical protein